MVCLPVLQKKLSYFHTLFQILRPLKSIPVFRPKQHKNHELIPFPPDRKKNPYPLERHIHISLIRGSTRPSRGFVWGKTVVPSCFKQEQSVHLEIWIKTSFTLLEGTMPSWVPHYYFFLVKAEQKVLLKIFSVMCLFSIASLKERYQMIIFEENEAWSFLVIFRQNRGLTWKTTIHKWKSRGIPIIACTGRLHPKGVRTFFRLQVNGRVRDFSCSST